MLRRQMLRHEMLMLKLVNINPDPNPNPHPNPNPYPALNQKPNHTHESNSVFGEVSMPEQLSPEHMSCHLDMIWLSTLSLHVLYMYSTVYAIIFAYSYFRGFGQVR